MPLSDEPPDYLRRLSKGWYTGHAWVHWTMGIEGRATGWLDGHVHLQMREILLHVMSRFQIVCPAYCLMPDHAHFLWMGIHSGSDQLKACQFFRRHWNRLLRGKGFGLQKQAYDHVLNEHEKNPEAFEDTRLYILKNPERGALVASWRDWPYVGAVAAGYPELDPREEDAVRNFWRVHNSAGRLS